MKRLLGCTLLVFLFFSFSLTMQAQELSLSAQKDLYITQIEKNIKKDNEENVEKYLTKLSSLDPALSKNMRIKYFMGKVSKQLKKEDHNTAISYMEKIIKLNPELPARFYYFYGKSLFKVKRNEDAKASLYRYVNEAGKDGKYYLASLGIIGDIDEESVRVKKEKERQQRKENELWDLVGKSNNPDKIKTYLKRYPNGKYVADAKDKIKEIELNRIYTDNKTGLMWQDNSFNEKLSWFAAKDYCDSLILSDHDDWQLPRVDQLSELYKKRSQLKSYDRTAYWTTSYYLNRPADTVYRVYFDNGRKRTKGKSKTDHVRCMRYPTKEHKIRSERRWNDNVLWEKVGGSNDLSQLRSYLNKYPNGLHAKQAKKNIADTTLWNSIKDSNDGNRLRSYLDRYPNGRHNWAAKQKIRKIESNRLYYDPKTELTWQDNRYLKKHTWEAAKEYCDTVVIKDYYNWRLPEGSELRDLGHIKHRLLSYENGKYWTSKETTAFHFGNYATIVDPDDDMNNVRCVRSEKSESFYLGNLYIDPDKTRLRFLNVGKKWPKWQDRVYSKSFLKSEAQFICYNLTQQISSAPEYQTVKLRAVYYRPNRRILGTLENEVNVRPGRKSFGYSRGRGWENPGNWPLGEYTVELFLDGHQLATGTFSIVR